MNKDSYIAKLDSGSTKELSRLFSTAPIMVHAIDVNGVICYANPFFINKLGYEYEEVIGQTSSSFLTSESANYALNHAIPLLKKQGFVEDVSYQFITKDEKIIDINLNGHITYDEQGEFLYGIGISTDVSEKKTYQRLLEKNEKQLLELNDELRAVLSSHMEMAEEMDQLIYSFSHDLRSPLCSIGGLMNLLDEDTTSTGSRREIIDRVENSIENMYSRINNIQDIHRNKLYKKGKTTSSFNLVVQEELDRYKYQIAENGIDLRTTITKQNVSIDEFRIKTIISILMSNAVQFYDSAKDDRYILLSSSVENNILNLTYEDNGIGISWEVNKKIFEMFFRGDSGSTGAGLGLYLLKKIVEKLNGSYQVESDLGKRFKLFISIPLQK